MKIYLIELDKRKYEYLKAQFSSLPEVIVLNEEFSRFLNKYNVEAVVSPANSFGIMDGGYDKAIISYFGSELQKSVHKYIIDNYYGEQPVGTSFTIKIPNTSKYLIHTPSMRVPEELVDPRVIYQCMRTSLIECIKNNIQSVVIPMFGGSTGNVHPRIVSNLMYKGYNQIINKPNKLDWDYVAKNMLYPIDKFKDY